MTLQQNLTGSTYQRGKPIHVLLTLRAGPDGAYLPDFFGAFNDTCSYGFSVELLTLHNKTADPHQQGCAYAGSTPQIAFTALAPGETRTWNSDVSTTSIAPGDYCLYAEYLISEQVIQWGKNLPSDRKRVAQGRITANPVLVLIR